MATIQVIGPDEMLSHWQQALPDAVIETFNEELVRLFNGIDASLREKHLLSLLDNKGVSSKNVQEQRWLKQAAELYKERGWKVVVRDCGRENNYDIHYQFALP
jgi:sugar/nucleoside kinase (ribokinase family)